MWTKIKSWFASTVKTVETKSRRTLDWLGGVEKTCVQVSKKTLSVIKRWPAWLFPFKAVAQATVETVEQALNSLVRMSVFTAIVVVKVVNMTCKGKVFFLDTDFLTIAAIHAVFRTVDVMMTSATFPLALVSFIMKPALITHKV